MTAVGLALTAGGCDRGWTVYQQVKLGQPLPAESPLTLAGEDANMNGPSTRPGTQPCYKWSEGGLWPFPLAAGVHGVTARTDSQGKVVVKSYSACTWSNYVILKVPALRQVVEVEVPVGIPLDPSEAAAGEGVPLGRGLERARTLPEYLHDAMQKGDFAGSGYSVGPVLGIFLGVGFVSGMVTYGGFYDLRESVEHLPLEGIDKDGYDRTFRPVAGGSIRVQNLGGRRIRMEANLLRVYDAFDLTPYLYAKGH